MHTRSGLLSCAVALAACTINPDPRTRPIALVQRDGHGGWIIVDRTAGASFAGELIAVEPGALRVLDGANLIVVPRSQVQRAELWAWDTDKGEATAWGAIGSVSTLSHGIFLVFTLPTWLITTAIAATTESRASQLVYPHDAWDDLVKWARFPQGLPAGIDAGALTHQNR